MQHVYPKLGFRLEPIQGELMVKAIYEFMRKLSNHHEQDYSISHLFIIDRRRCNLSVVLFNFAYQSHPIQIDVELPQFGW